MPSAEPDNLSLILQIVRYLKPKSILDIGIGTGRYGVLFRDYLDGHWAGLAFHDKKTWKLILDGIEIFEKYITPVHQYVYTKIIIADAFKHILTTTPTHYDLVFLGDVLEHFVLEDGKLLLTHLLKNWLTGTGHILISTPNFKTRMNCPKQAVFGNQNEIHHSQWSETEFKQLFPNCKVYSGRLLTVQI